MSRIRTIKPAFFRSLNVGGLPKATRLTYVGLWTYADDAGRGVDDPRLIKAELWPLDDDYPVKKVAADLALLAAPSDCSQCPDDKHGFICRYGDGRYFHIIHWSHQTISHPQLSLLQSCPLHERSRNVPESNGNVHGTTPESNRNDPGRGPERSRKRTGTIQGEGKGREGKGKEGNKPSSSSGELEPPPPANPDDDETGSPKPIFETACQLLATRDLHRRETERGKVGDRDAWLAEAVDRRRGQHSTRAAELTAERHGLTPVELADLLDPPTSFADLLDPPTSFADLLDPATSTPPLPPDPLNGTRAAASAKAARNDLPACPTCDTRGGDGKLLRADGMAVPCPTCAPVAR
jgi:hypothetical protein